MVRSPPKIVIDRGNPADGSPADGSFADGSPADGSPADGSFVQELLRNQRRIYLFIGSLLPDPDDIEDVYQQTCLALWQKRDRLPAVRDFFGWACGFARNEVLHQRRRNSRKGAAHLSEQLLEKLADEFAAEAVGEEERLSALAACLARLEGRQRTLLERCYSGSESIKQIAGDMSISAAALTMRLQRIRHALVKCIDKARGETAAS